MSLRRPKVFFTYLPCLEALYRVADSSLLNSSVQICHCYTNVLADVLYKIYGIKSRLNYYL